MEQDKTSAGQEKLEVAEAESGGAKKEVESGSDSRTQIVDKT
jgi:hypothetical protein